VLEEGAQQSKAEGQPVLEGARPSAAQAAGWHSATMQAAMSRSTALPVANLGSVVTAAQLQPPLHAGVDNIEHSVPSPVAHVPVGPVSSAHGCEQPASDINSMQTCLEMEGGGRGLLSPTALPVLGFNRAHGCPDVVMDQFASPFVPMGLTLAMSTVPADDRLPSVGGAHTQLQAASELATPKPTRKPAPAAPIATLVDVQLRSPLKKMLGLVCATRYVLCCSQLPLATTTFTSLQCLSGQVLCKVLITTGSMQPQQSYRAKRSWMSWK
jgi:hypothetical protein